MGGHAVDEGGNEAEKEKGLVLVFREGGERNAMEIIEGLSAVEGMRWTVKERIQ